jgi:peptidoglycan/LPS O-acetylase OafA/YrhL
MNLAPVAPIEERPAAADKTIAVLQAGRGVAAIAVVFHHACAAVDAFSVGMPLWLRSAGGLGYLGVDFFFVLSGFIMAHIHRGGRERGVGQFAKSRLLRVFTPYLPVGIGMALIYTLMPNLSAGTREWNWLATTTLLPGAGEPALVVAWTLQFELFFYAMFGLGLALRSPFWTISAWVAVALGYNVVFGAPPPPFGPFLASIVIEFLFGMAAAALVANGRFRYPAIASLAVAIAYLLLGAQAEHRELIALAMAFFIVSLVRKEQANMLSVPRWTVFLGAASYSIYLVHNPITALAGRLSTSWWIILLSGLALGIIAGFVYHLVFERPALRLLMSGRRSLPAAQGKPAATKRLAKEDM